MTLDLLICLFAICISLLMKCLFRSFACFSLGFLSYCWLLKLIVYFGYKSFIRYVLQNFFLVYGLSFHSLNSCFHRAVLSFNKSLTSTISFTDHIFGILFKNSLPKQNHLDFLQFFSCPEDRFQGSKSQAPLLTSLATLGKFLTSLCSTILVYKTG